MTFAFSTFLSWYLPDAATGDTGAYAVELSEDRIARLVDAATAVACFARFELGAQLRARTVTECAS